MRRFYQLYWICAYAEWPTSILFKQILASSEKIYTQIEKQLLAQVLGAESDHQYVYSRKIKLWSDHKQAFVIKSFPSFGTRLWNCLHPDWRNQLTKRTFKRKILKLLLTVLEIEDYYVDVHSLILNLNTSNYYTLQLSTSHVAVYLLYTFQFALPLYLINC